jgi:hypothetical protein
MIKKWKKIFKQFNPKDIFSEDLLAEIEQEKSLQDIRDKINRCKNDIKNMGFDLFD